MFEILDVALFLAIVALILYILVVTGVLVFTGSGEVIHILLVIAIVLFIIWIVIRLFGCFRDGRGWRGYRNRNNPEVIV